MEGDGIRLNATRINIEEGNSSKDGSGPFPPPWPETFCFHQ